MHESNFLASSALDHTREVSPHEMANAIRVLAMDAVERAKSGHPGMPMGMADVATIDGLNQEPDALFSIPDEPVEFIRVRVRT